MRVHQQAFEADGSGTVSFEAEETDDLWNLYNLISTDDKVTAAAIRKVQRTDAVGTVATDTKRTVATLSVTAAEFDSESGTLRVSGKTCEPNQYIHLGSYHTVTIKPSMNLKLYKSCWDFISKQKLKEAIEPRRSAEVAVVLIDMGISNMYILTQSLVKDLCTIRVTIPKKRSGASGYDKAKEKFFSQTFSAIVNRIDFAVIQCIILAGPGFVPTDFYEWMLKYAEQKRFTVVLSNKKKFIVCKASSAYKHSVHELLTDSVVMERVADAKAVKHAAALEALYRALHSGSADACYGIQQAEYAVKHHAVKTLMVTDKLFRSSDVPTRLKYARLAESVHRNGGDVLVFSDMHVSGQQLQQLSGIAALLLFPLPELDNLDQRQSVDASVA